MNNNIDIYFFTDLKLDTKMSTNTINATDLISDAKISNTI